MSKVQADDHRIVPDNLPVSDAKPSREPRNSYMSQTSKKIPVFARPGIIQYVWNEKLEAFQSEILKSPVQHINLVNRKEFSDLHIICGQQTLYSYASVIEVRCPLLISKFTKSSPKRGHPTVIKIDEKAIDPVSLYHVLYFIFTGTVSFSALTPDRVIFILHAAEILELKRLVCLCENYFWYALDLVLSLAATNNVERVKRICVKYGSSVFKELINNKEGVISLGLELFLEFVQFTFSKDSDYGPSNVGIDDTIRNNFETIFNAMNVDALMAFDDGSVKFHRAFLLSQPSQIMNYLTECEELVDSYYLYRLSPGVKMSSGAFKSFLSYLYYKNTDFSASDAAQILPFAHTYRFHNVIKACQLKIERNINVDSVLDIFSLSYVKGISSNYKESYYSICLKFIVDNFTEINFKSLSGKPSEMVYDIAVSISNALKAGKFVFSELNGENSSNCIDFSVHDLSASSIDRIIKKKDSFIDQNGDSKDILQKKKTNSKLNVESEKNGPKDGIRENSKKEFFREQRYEKDSRNDVAVPDQDVLIEMVVRQSSYEVPSNNIEIDRRTGY